MTEMPEKIRFCHNTKCEVYNQMQGDFGYEEVYSFPCCGCSRTLTKKNAIEHVQQSITLNKNTIGKTTKNKGE